MPVWKRKGEGHGVHTGSENFHLEVMYIIPKYISMAKEVKWPSLMPIIQRGIIILREGNLTGSKNYVE